MSKNQTVMKSNYAFTLIRQRADCYYNTITVDYTPPINLNKISNSIVPVFLNDKIYYTPGFINANEMSYFEKADSFQKAKFSGRVSKACEGCNDQKMDLQNVSQLLLPVPSTNYCQICKGGYVQYWKHLDEASHQRQSGFSRANTYMAQLCKRYKKTNEKGNAKKKNQPIKKAKQEKCAKKHQPSRLKKSKVVSQNPPGIKHNNCSTNLPSVIPSQYC